MGIHYPLNLNNIFTRSRIKKVFMTIPYNATPHSLLNYFNDGITDKNILEEIKIIFPQFLIAIMKTYESLFFNKLETLKKHKRLNKLEFTIDKQTFDYKYYKVNEIRKEKVFKGIRCRYMEYEQTIEIYEKKQNIALYANIIHTTDAIFLKKVYINCKKKNISIHTIHDEFVVPANDYFEFIKICNDTQKEIFKDINNYDIYCNSFFIVL
jgi:hypothetical protein